jgi:hypothetical protein
MNWKNKINCSEDEQIELDRYCKIYSVERYNYYYSMLLKCTKKKYDYLDFKDFIIYHDKLLQVLFQICTIIEKRLKGNIQKNEELKNIFIPIFDDMRVGKVDYELPKKVNESGFVVLINSYKKWLDLNNMKCEEITQIRNDVMHSNKINISDLSDRVETLLSFLNDQEFIDEKIKKINSLFDNKIKGNKSFAESYRLNIYNKVKPIHEKI